MVTLAWNQCWPCPTAHESLSLLTSSLPFIPGQVLEGQTGNTGWGSHCVSGQDACGGGHPQIWASRAESGVVSSPYHPANGQLARGSGRWGAAPLAGQLFPEHFVILLPAFRRTIYRQESGRLLCPLPTLFPVWNWHSHYSLFLFSLLRQGVAQADLKLTV